MGLGMGETMHNGSEPDKSKQVETEERQQPDVSGSGDPAPDSGNERDRNAEAAELASRLDTLAVRIEASRIAEYVELLHHPRKLMMSSLLTGIARGIGLTIGVTVFTAILIQLLRMLGALNLPLIGDWIADLVQIVEGELEGRNIGY